MRARGRPAAALEWQSGKVHFSVFEHASGGKNQGGPGQETGLLNRSCGLPRGARQLREAITDAIIVIAE